MAYCPKCGKNKTRMIQSIATTVAHLLLGRRILRQIGKIGARRNVPVVDPNTDR